MSFWDKVKRDLQKGMREGIAVIKEGAVVVKAKAGELTKEGQKQYKAMAIKSKVQKEIAELGGKVYDIRSKVKNPLSDNTVKAIVSRIGKLEAQIISLEGKVMPKPKAKAKTKPKAKAPAKKTVKKPVIKTAKPTVKKTSAKRPASAKSR